MSGICIIFNRDGSHVSRSLLQQMTRSMAHRGGDGVGYFVDRNVGLGYQAAFITPESTEEIMPLADDTGRLRIVFDGRIDNRQELQAKLTAHDEAPRGCGDAELVLRAYRVWGEHCPAHLLGDFAFAIWNGGTRELFCARDPMGMKPFYYRVHNGAFVCASEIQPLLQDPKFEVKPNLALIGLYLAGDYGEQEETLYAGIYRLPQAHALTVTDAALHKSKYWDADPDQKIRYHSDREYAEHFLELFSDAVKCRLRARGPVGALLSGGLDSSSIVCMADNLYRDGVAPNHGFMPCSVVFDELQCDEREYVESIVNERRMKVSFFPYERFRHHLDFDNTGDFPDVFYGPTLFMDREALEAMRSGGARILLDGIGGDELLAPGFDHLRDLLRKGHLLRLARELKEISENYDISLLYALRTYVLAPSIPARIRAVLKPLVRQFEPAPPEPIFKQEFLQSSGAARLIGRRFAAPAFQNRWRRTLYDLLFVGWNATVARDAAELFASRFGLETRRPFMDRRLVEFALAVPIEQIWRNGQGKRVMRNAMIGLLPDKIRLRRGKGIYTPMINLEFRTLQGDQIEAMVADSLLGEIGAIDVGRAVALIRSYRSGDEKYVLSMIDTLIGLDLFLRHMERRWKSGNLHRDPDSLALASAQR